METVIERIEKVCKEFNISITELSKRINMPQTTVNSYMNGSRKMSYEFAESVITTFGLNANWIVTGNGQMFFNNIAGRDNNIVDGDNKGIVGSNNTTGSVGGNHVSLGDQKIKKLLKNDEITIEMEQSVEKELLQQTNRHLETRIKDLEKLNSSQSKTIETMQLLLDRLTNK